MANVHLWAGIKNIIDIDHPLQISGETIHDLLENLKKKYPQLQPILEEGVSFSVDDILVFSSTSHKVNDKSEVYIFQKISGG